jgi:hypothetical protein
MEVVQERLGHSSISITMDRYSHVIEGMDRAQPRLLPRSSNSRPVDGQSRDSQALIGHRHI